MRNVLFSGVGDSDGASFGESSGCASARKSASTGERGEASDASEKSSSSGAGVVVVGGVVGVEATTFLKPVRIGVRGVDCCGCVGCVEFVCVCDTLFTGCNTGVFAVDGENKEPRLFINELPNELVLELGLVTSTTRVETSCPS